MMSLHTGVTVAMAGPSKVLRSNDANKNKFKKYNLRSYFEMIRKQSKSLPVEKHRQDAHIASLRLSPANEFRHFPKLDVVIIIHQFDIAPPKNVKWALQPPKTKTDQTNKQVKWLMVC